MEVNMIFLMYVLYSFFIYIFFMFILAMTFNKQLVGKDKDTLSRKRPYRAYFHTQACAFLFFIYFGRFFIICLTDRLIQKLQTWYWTRNIFSCILKCIKLIINSNLLIIHCNCVSFSEFYPQIKVRKLDIAISRHM